MRISKKDIKLAAEKRYPDKDKSKYQYGCLESLREGYVQGRKACEQQIESEITTLYIEACDNYNKTLPKTEETNDDSWYYEGKRNAYSEVLKLWKSKQ
jgi:hypothetical protein